MRFRITSKDLIIFVSFCIFLLLLSSLAVSNVINVLNEGEFLGLNPFIGFTGKYILGTLFLFFGVLIAIFISTSSYIFEKEKGHGLGLSVSEKNETGYSRWAKQEEIKKSPKIVRVPISLPNASAAGVVLINDGKDMWVDNSSNHTLVIGATGSGKTTSVVDPLVYSLSKAKESMIITDPKGEIYKMHSNMLRARGYKIVVLNFRDPQKGNCWNPLTLPYKLYKAGSTDKSTELVDDVALNILQDKKAQDPFWEKSASDYFAGVSLGLFEDAKEEDINLNSINYVTTIGEEKFGAGSNYIKEYFNLKGESSAPYVFASNTINSPAETKGGILSVFRQKIRLFASREQLSEMLSKSDFDMQEIGKVPTAVFMVIHDEKTTYHALATIFIKQCYETLIDVAQASGGQLPVRTNFILDEFANMPPLKDVTSMVTAARSRDIRFTFIIQNYAQLNDVYGKEDAETIRSNCGNLIYILTSELAALEEISKLCGEKKSKEKDKTASTPLATVSDLQKMKMNEVIIIRARANPFKTKLKPSYEINWGSSYKKADFIERQKGEVGLFDLREFVKSKKKEKLFAGNEDSENSGGFNPFMNPTTSIPNSINNPNVFNSSNNTKPFLTNDDSNGEFNVDDLLKKIDAKIAELEEEEKNEKESTEVEAYDNKKVVNNTPNNTQIMDFGNIMQNEEDDNEKTELLNFDSIINNNDNKNAIEDKTEALNFDDLLKNLNTNNQEDENKSVKKDQINTKKIDGEDNISDDQYFDDFFQDE